MFLRLKILLHNKNVPKKMSEKTANYFSKTEFSLKTANQHPCIQIRITKSSLNKDRVHYGFPGVIWTNILKAMSWDVF